MLPDFPHSSVADMNDSADIRFLLTLRESGSLIAAARKLGLSASAVTQRLQQLEKKLGAQLVNRTARRLQFTDEGHAAVRTRRRTRRAVRRVVRRLADAPRRACRHAENQRAARLRAAPPRARDRRVPAAEPGYRRRAHAVRPAFDRDDGPFRYRRCISASCRYRIWSAIRSRRMRASSARRPRWSSGWARRSRRTR